jgi:hypothetical protein
LTYEFECLEGTLKNIGCHHHYFKDVAVSIKDSDGNEINVKTETTEANQSTVYSLEGLILNNTTYFVTITATRASSKKDDPDLANPEVTSQWQDDLWI